MNEPTFRIQMAAEMSGVKEGLIRAWERRYGVLKPPRSPGGYRTYTSADIDVLKRLKRLTEEGIAIADAVKMLPEITREARGVDAAPTVPQEEQLKLWINDVMAAGKRMDQQRIEAVLDSAIQRLPPLVFFEGFVVPLLREVGDRWHAGALTIAEEHLISQPVRQRLISLLSKSPRRSKHHVVCACLENEEHEVGLIGAALRFRHQGYRVTFLGARTPVDQLLRVVNTVKPELVALSVVEAEGLDAQLAELAAGLPPGTKVLFGGPGVAHLQKTIKRLGLSLDGDSP